jgi:hypothetical protein
MNQLIESRLKGIFRSFKVFRSNGDVIAHTINEFQEWDFDDNHVLTITQYQQHRKKTICHTDQWTLEFHNRRYFINIPQPPLRLEVISINHLGMVVEMSERGEKIFFAQFPAWERLVKNNLPVL